MSTGKTAFVTGAAQGLGNAIARALHAAGHQVALADMNLDKARGVAAELGKGAMAIGVDVRDRHAVNAAVAECTAKLGQPDILVNNAARTQARDFLAITQEEWDDVLAINLRGMLFASQAVLPGMMAKKWGRIVNLSSVAGLRGGPQVQGAHYASSKAAIIGFTRYLAYDFAKHGITVNAIAPGPILTEQTALAPADKVAMVAAQIPVGRIGDPKDVGALVAHVCSDAGGFITGATLDISGGLVMR